MREKLIEFLKGTPDIWMSDTASEMLADDLIANGVTIPVRCKDCTHYETGRRLTPYCKCPKGLKEPSDNRFCSYGERGDENA